MKDLSCATVKDTRTLDALPGFQDPDQNHANPVRPGPLRVLHLHLQFSVVDYAIVHLSQPPGN